MKGLTTDEIFEQNNALNMFTNFNNGLSILTKELQSLERVLPDCHERFVKENIERAILSLKSLISDIEMASERANEQRRYACDNKYLKTLTR